MTEIKREILRRFVQNPPTPEDRKRFRYWDNFYSYFIDLGWSRSAVWLGLTELADDGWCKWGELGLVQIHTVERAAELQTILEEK
jgi:hypothetical protein